MKESIQKIEPSEFWQWFTENESSFSEIVVGGEDSDRDVLQGECISKLHEFNDGLFFEIGGRDDGNKKDFIITAEGNKDLFTKVEDLVGAAPQYDTWDIIALKPPLGADFQLTYEGVDMDPNNMWFLPLKNEDNPDEIGLRVGIPDFDAEEEKQYIAGLYLILDALLGEKSNAQDIGYLEVDPLPEGYTAMGYIEMISLPEFIGIKKSE